MDIMANYIVNKLVHLYNLFMLCTSTYTRRHVILTSFLITIQHYGRTCRTNFL